MEYKFHHDASCSLIMTVPFDLRELGKEVEASSNAHQRLHTSLSQCITTRQATSFL